MAEFVFEDSGKALNIYTSLEGKNKYSVDPNDFSIIVPSGNGVYGFHKNTTDPFKSISLQEGTGGLIYFENQISKDNFFTLTTILGISRALNPKWENRDYAAFYKESQNPKEEGFLSQIRLVSKFSLRFLFKSIDEHEYNNFPTQDLTMAEACWAFISGQKKRWGTDFTSPKLNGKFGGDGDYAREELSFGLMVENNYHNIYRIWSRAWLVTK